MSSLSSPLSRCPSCGVVGCSGSCHLGTTIPSTRSATAPVGRSHGARVEGRVISHPIVSAALPGLGAVVRRAFPLLALVWFLTTPGVLEMLLVLGVLVGIMVWVLRSVAGASRPLGVGRFLTSMLGGWLRLGSGYDPGAEMAFRVQPTAGTGVRVVRVAGHADGVALGDDVSVRGVPTPRGLVSARLSNRTTGLTMMSPGLALTVLFGVVDVVLLGVIVSRFM